jgi:superfamily II DNA or RNA helicase
MPVEWRYAKDSLRLQGAATEGAQGIAEGDARRQTVTAEAILDHLRTQPGMVLADEVGMGKTYVALAVIASVLASTKSSRVPVVVMVPPGLLGTWRRAWQRFKARCTIGDSFAWMEAREKVATSPTDLFKLLDDPPSRNARLIFLKTSCFSQERVDPWIKLALVRYARTHTKMTAEEHKRIHKWAGALTRQEGKHLSPTLIAHLLKTDPTEWKVRLVAEGVLSKTDDEPVPVHLDRCKDKLDYRGLIGVLRKEVPGRKGSVSKATLQKVRRMFNEQCQDLHRQWLQHARWQASLLVLDEAHHAKNDSTKLAGLFRSDELTALIEERADTARPGLWQKADRMLFLTATPFQLGHDELIRVLRSFAAVRWNTADAPIKSREEFVKVLDVLKTRLNENRLAGRRLDALWGRLSAESAGPHMFNEDPASPPPTLLAAEVRSAIAECRRSKVAAERDATESWNGLYHWVIRHNRTPALLRDASEIDGVTVPRRVSRAGMSILEPAEVPVASSDGLTIAGAPALPFLLSARAQAELAATSARARAFFAEGLSSSYEAFHHTREHRADVRDDRLADDDLPHVASESVVPLEWYEDHVAKLIPQKTKAVACFDHPKIRAVVDRAVSLWLTGEKVLIFAFYRETLKALRDHLRREADRRLGELAAERLGMPAKNSAGAHEVVVRIGKRFADADSPFQKALDDLLEEELSHYPQLRRRHEEIYGAVAAYVRTPAFIARFMPLDDLAFRKATQFGESRADVVREGVEAFKAGFASRTDASGMSMQARVRRFLAFAHELALESTVRHVDADETSKSPLDEYLDAVVGIRREWLKDDPDGESGRRMRISRAFSVVRAAFGRTPRDVRERLMLAFNSPLFPEILVSSGVLGEGVDLHRFCRHLIHHDLDWNPSSLEQRTGRLDRIHCKAEMVRRPIVVYLPFIAGSADEKMFRVVRDRERWFQVVMGQKFELDERTTETLASRVPLPPEVASELLFDLARWKG